MSDAEHPEIEIECPECRKLIPAGKSISDPRICACKKAAFAVAYEMGKYIIRRVR